MFRKKSILLFYSILFSISLFAQNRDIINAEYFWDSDPGEGSATALVAFDGNFDEVIEDIISSSTITFPTGGPHVFNIRVQDENATWSPAFKRVIDFSTPSQLRDLHINIAEYFWDNDYTAITACEKSRVIKQDEITEIEKSKINTLETHNFIFFDKNEKKYIKLFQ